MISSEGEARGERDNVLRFCESIIDVEHYQGYYRKVGDSRQFTYGFVSFLFYLGRMALWREELGWMR